MRKRERERDGERERETTQLPPSLSVVLELLLASVSPHETAAASG